MSDLNWTGTVGPRQLKRIVDATRTFERRATSVTRTCGGVVFEIALLGASIPAQHRKTLADIHAKYAGCLSKANAARVAEEIEAAAAAIVPPEEEQAS